MKFLWKLLVSIKNVFPQEKLVFLFEKSWVFRWKPVEWQIENLNFLRKGLVFFWRMLFSPGNLTIVPENLMVPEEKPCECKVSLRKLCVSRENHRNSQETSILLRKTLNFL